MRIYKTLKTLLIILILLNISCALMQGTRKSEKNIRKEIIKGKTTETMILTLLGMPTSVTTNSIGDEVWIYKNMLYSTIKSTDGNMLILWELPTGQSTEVPKPFDLLITIDQNDVVKDFEILSNSF